MSTIDERGSQREAIIERINKRLNTLLWMVGLNIAWQTVLIAAAVGIILTYR